MIETQQLNLPFEEVWNQIDPKIKNTFDREQIKAIQKILNPSVNNHHTVDLRISLPISKLNFYLVFLAGKERRSKQRLQYERALHPLWTPINSLFLIVALIILLGSSFTIFFDVLSSVSYTFSSLEENPTSIPWIDNESDCGYTRRIWRDNKCWDSEHNPLF
jgi:heme/copper-type cytochrome/quinol oxidase subunit 1